MRHLASSKILSSSLELHASHFQIKDPKLSTPERQTSDSEPTRLRLFVRYNFKLKNVHTAHLDFEFIYPQTTPGSHNNTLETFDTKCHHLTLITN
jgi:hypothetical protein